MQQNSGASMAQVEMQQAAQDCMNCHAVCLQTAKQCQQAGGKHAEAAHIQMLQDCAELCQVTAHMLQHSSPIAPVVCGATAQVTERCAFECEQMGDTNCVNACRNASSSVGQIAKIIM
jgi:hypothetical protein